MPPMPLSPAAASRPQSAALTAYLQGGQWQSKWNNYYSRVRIVSNTLAGNSYTVNAGKIVYAFGYGRGQDMAAGGQGGYVATAADTNILTANQTISGEAVEIDGVGLILASWSDANLAKQLDPCVSVKIKTNGTTEYLMGNPSMVPGPGGLFGASEAWSTAPSLPDAISRSVGAMSNGLPHPSTFFPLPEPMLWVASGRGDSNLNVILTVEQAASTLAQFGGPARAAATGVQAYTPPTTAQVFVDYMIVLVGRTVNPLSNN